MILRYPLVLLFLFSATLSYSGMNFVEAQTCVGYQEVPITSATRAQATAAGIPTTSNCWNPTNPHVGMSVGEAKQYLNSLPKRPLSSCAPPTESNIQRLNDSFAICAARFFKEYTARHGAVYITSAYRDGPSGANKCAGGVEGSNHTIGIAIDVNPANSGLYPTMWSFAKNNPQFGVCFPHEGADRPHMILAGTNGGEAAKCAKLGVSKACDGSNFNPNSIKPATPSASPPTSQLAETIRQALGLQQPQPLAAQPAFPQQQLSSAQSPTSAFTPSLPTPTLVAESTSLGTVSPGTSQNPGTPITSVADRLEELTFGVRATSSSPTQSATTVPLVINGTDTRSIQGVTPTTEVTQLTSTTTVGSTLVQQTFVSRDLNQSAPPAPSSNSRVIQILAQLKTALLKMLEYLQPFSSRSIYKTEVYE